MSALAKAKAAAEAAGSGSLSSGEAALRSGPPSRPMSIEHAVASPNRSQQRDAPVLALPLSAPYRVQITNLESGVVSDYQPRPGTEQARFRNHIAVV